MSPSGAFAAVWAAVIVAGLIFGRSPPREDDLDALLEDSPAAQTYRVFVETFGPDDLVVFQVSAADPEVVIRGVQGAHRAARNASGVGLVLTASSALGSVMDLLSDPELGGASALPGLKPSLSSPLNDMFGLLAPDGTRGRAFIVLSATETDGRASLLSALRSLAEELRGAGAETALAGSATLNEALREQREALERWALPLAALACGLTLLVILRSIGVVLILVAPLAASVLAVQRTLGAAGGSINILTAAAPPITLAILLASAIHVVIAWAERRTAGASPAEAARAAVAAKRTAVLIALGTTAVGFGALAVSATGPIRSFGVATALGLGVGLGGVLFAVPALLSRWTPAPRARTVALGRAARRLAEFGVERPVYAIAVGVGLTGLGGWAATTLPREVHAITYFPDTAPIVQSTRTLEEEGLGLQSFEVVVSPFEPMEDLARLDALGEALEELAMVERRLDLSVVAREANHRLAGVDALPNPALLETLIESPSAPARRTWDPSSGRARISLFTSSRSYDDIARLGEDVRRLARDRFEHVEVTGNLALILDAQSSLIRTLVQSLIITLLIMQAVVVGVLGARGLGWAATLPNLIPVAMVFTTMSIFGIPLDLATCMVAALTLGIAVDDTLHFGFACRSASSVQAAERTGAGIIVSSLTLAAGFSVLTATSFAPTFRFGVLASTAMVWALVADLWIFPALIRVLEPSRKV